MSDLKHKLSIYINQAIEKHGGDISISPTSIAASVVRTLDPNNSTIDIISYGFNMQVRVVARSILGKTFAPKDEDAQHEMFEGLQERYPTAAASDNYVERHYLTLEQRLYNVERLQKTGLSFIAHSEKLLAETEELDAAGHFADIIEQ